MTRPVDRLLRRLMTWAVRRGRSGEPVWLAVAAALWLVRRSRRRPDAVVWSGRLRPGERLGIALAEPGAGAPSSPEG